MQARYHHDSNNDEWVIRLHRKDGGFSSIGGCVGLEEAQLVCSALNALVSLSEVTFDEYAAELTDDGIVVDRVRVNHDSLDAWHDFRADAVDATNLLFSYGR